MHFNLRFFLNLVCIVLTLTIHCSAMYLKTVLAQDLAQVVTPTRDGETESTELPNVMIMLIDDMGVMDTSVPFLVDREGKPVRYPLNDAYRTPNMERLAKRGARFTEFYAMSVCSPSRISLMTGQNSARHRTTTWINPDTNNKGPNGPPEWNWQGLDTNSFTMARWFHDAGYRTIHVGKGHFGPRNTPGEDPTNLGFDINVGGSSIGQPGSYYGTKNFGNLGPKPTHGVPGLEAYHGKEIFLNEALTLEAQRYVTESVRDSKPFFLYFPHYAVHAPFQPDPNFAADSQPEFKNKNSQAYASLIQSMDDSLGKMLAHFESLNVAENTLVIFLGDNGSDAPLGGPHEVASSAPLRGKKGSHYEGGVRVPFMISWAKPASNAIQNQFKIPAGSIVRQWGAIYDVLPTVAELIHREIPSTHRVDGRSLLGSLNDLDSGTQVREREFLMHFPHAPHRSNYFTIFRKGDWKLIYHYFPTPPGQASHFQLFSLSEDPFEQHDLAESNPEILKELIAQMTSSLDQQNALYPVDPQGKPVRPSQP